MEAVEVAPKSQPMTTDALDHLAKQRRREAEEMEAILAKRQQAERERQEQADREAEARARAEQEKRDKAEREARRWSEINAAPMPNGDSWPMCQVAWLAAEGVERVVLCVEPLRLPMLVDGDLVIADTGIQLKVTEMVSPVVTAHAANMLVDVYQDAARAEFLALLRRTRELMGNGPTLYTSALPSVTVTDAGPHSQHVGGPSGSHKVIRASWGDCYIHNPIRNKE